MRYLMAPAPTHCFDLTFNKGICQERASFFNLLTKKLLGDRWCDKECLGLLISADFNRIGPAVTAGGQQVLFALH